MYTEILVRSVHCLLFSSFVPFKFYGLLPNFMDSEYFNQRAKFALSITISHLKNNLICDKHIAYDGNIPFDIGSLILCEWHASSCVTESYKVWPKKITKQL